MTSVLKLRLSEASNFPVSKRLQCSVKLCISIDNVPHPPLSQSGLLWLQNKILIQLFSYLRGCSRVNCWKWKRWANIEIWQERCPLVTGLWSILSKLFSDSAAPMTLSTSHFVKAKLCEKKCNTAVFKQTPQTFAHSKHFVAKCLCMQI